jgi:hypothetical protein
MTPAPMTLPKRTPKPVTAAPDGDAASRLSRRRISEPVALFVVFALVYLGVAGLMTERNIVFADAMARVGNAYFVLFSRYPHLPAIGFVWNPLPSLVLLPILPLKPLVPWLVSHGFAGAIQSAVTMAATVAVLASCLRKLHVPRVPRLVLTALFAVQPMILLYAGSGLSEAMLLLFLSLTVSCLISWMRENQAGSLVGAGVALGLAYLTRYEAIAPAAGVAVLVGVLSWLRAEGSRSTRRTIAANDVILIAAPFALAFALWMVMSRILIGQWLATFSSTYGNSAQVRSGQSSIQSVTGTTLTETSGYIARQIQGMAPLFAILLAVAAIMALRRRDVAALAGPVVFGAVSAFNAIVLLMGSSFGWLRFQITVIPLTTILAGTVLAAATGKATRQVPLTRDPRPLPLPGKHRPPQRRRRVATALMTAAVTGGVTLALPVQMHTLTDTRTGLAREESPMLHSAISPALATNEERRSLLIYHTESEIAAYIDHLNPGDASVLADTAYAYSVVMSSKHPKQFIITSDLDFAGAVSDPSGHRVMYLLVPAPELGHADALRARWPTLYQDGAGISSQVHAFRGAFFGDWRLYRVN